MTSASSLSSRGSRRHSVARLSSGELTAKKGFSVVAPMRTTRPSSTAGRRASCWDLLKRCTSSTKRIVPRPCSPRRRRASSRAAAHVGHTGVDGRQGDEGLGRRDRHHLGQGGLPRAGRAPQDGRGQSVGFDEGPQRGMRRHQMALAHDVVEGPGPQPGGQGAALAQPVGGGLGEEVGGARPGAARWRAGHGPVSCGPTGSVARGGDPQAQVVQRPLGQRLGGAGHGVGP